jgi:hypothetical protein
MRLRIPHTCATDRSDHSTSATSHQRRDCTRTLRTRARCGASDPENAAAAPRGTRHCHGTDTHTSAWIESPVALARKTYRVLARRGDVQVQGSPCWLSCGLTTAVERLAGTLARFTTRSLSAGPLQPLVRRPAHGLQHCLGMPGYYLKKDAGAALGLSTALFPVTERGGADAHECREFVLAQTVALAHRSDIDLLEPIGSRRLCLATEDSSTLSDTLEKLSKQFFSHGYSISTILRRARRCAAVRSARSFFGKTKSIRRCWDLACQK